VETRRGQGAFEYILMLSGVLLVVITIIYMMQGSVTQADSTLDAQMKSAGIALDPSYYVPGAKPQFMPNSPADGAGSTARPNISALITVKDTQLYEVKYNWNGINYTVYDGYLVHALDFENSGLLGENESSASDISQSQNTCAAMGKANTTVMLSMDEGGGLVTRDTSTNAINGYLFGGDTGTADSGTTTSAVHETSDYALSYSAGTYNGWTLRVNSGGGAGGSAAVSSFTVPSQQNNKFVSLSAPITGLGSGSNYQIYFEDTTGPEWTDGISGNALEFDGVDDHMNLGSFAISGGSHITLSAWIRPRKTTGQQYIFVKNGPIFWYLNGDRLTLGTLTGVTGSNHFSGTRPIKANEWTHVAATYNGTHKKLYVNGALDATTLVSGTMGGDGCPQIGRYNNGGCYGGPSNHFNGTIDEFALYDRALDASEISAIYNKAKATNGRWAATSAWGDGAVRFNGLGDYLGCGTPEGTEMETGDFTVELWARALGGTYGRGIISKGGWGSTGFFISEAYSPADQYYFGVRDSTGHKEVTLGLSTTFDWKHIVGVKTANHLEVWVNGIKANEINTAIGNLSNPSQNLLIGRSYDGYFFNGSVDYVRIWKRALSAAEINMHYRSSLNKYTANAWFFGYRNDSLGYGTYNYTLYTSGGYKKDGATPTRTVKYCQLPWPC